VYANVVSRVIHSCYLIIDI